MSIDSPSASVPPPSEPPGLPVLDRSAAGGAAPQFAARILVVDDETAQMRALCDTLRDHGYETVGCAAAAPALEVLRGARFDLILADLMMPGMDGIALLQAARQIDPDLVGIIMTGEGSIASAVDAMKSGALDYILKPFKLSVILPVLARALAVRSLRLENIALEARVRERTVDLEAALKELESFSYSVSHDLRAPLRIADAYLHMLLEDFSLQMPAEAGRLLGVASHSIQHMGELIEDLLRFASLGRQPLSRHAVDTAALVRDTLEELLAGMPGRRAGIEVGHLPGCVGDLGLLRQVFFNLLSNALKFTRHKEGARIEVGGRAEESGCVYFVRDNGAGFDMRYADKLFGAFQRFHSSEEFEGSGIGLSIVHRIVERHGGAIWAESEPGRGASFHFRLPG